MQPPLSAARPVSCALDGLQYLPAVRARRVWERIWEELHMALREALDREASAEGEAPAMAATAK